MKKELVMPELLAPAGNLEKLKIALDFGADAVYFGIPDFSLRARVNQFDKETIKKAAEICRQRNKKFYVTLNIYAHNQHFKKLPEYIDFLKEIKPDGLIISDPGILRIIKKELPEIAIHISTQANVTNYEAANFWKSQGAERVILAREVTLTEIEEIAKKAENIELEYFVHGAMCMSYSGRCILSKWMTNRSANLGDCAQPCRWNYKTKEAPKKMTVIDDKDRFEMKVEEDQHGTYLFNSYDICLLEHLEKLMDAGVMSFKIEGRAKSVYYLAIVVRAYRKVIDALWKKRNGQNIDLGKIIKEQKEGLDKLANRGYWTGFLLDNEPPHLFEKDSTKTNWMFCGISNEQVESNIRKVMVHNFFNVGDELEVITPDETFKVKVQKILNNQQEEILTAHGGQNQLFEIEFDKPIDSIFLMRKLVG